MLGLACLLFGMPVSLHAQKLSDEQVVSLVKEQKAAGKSDKEIGQMLVARGVTREQLERIKADYEESQGGSNQVVSPGGTDEARSRRAVESSFTETTAGSLDLIGESVASRELQQDTAAVRMVYGRDIFNTRSLTFEPNENMATPVNYRLGPGDEVIVDIWGANEATIRQVISPEGNIMVSQIGPIYLSGLTIAEAGDRIRENLSRKYAGISGDNPESQVRVTLGQIRTIQINVMGEVAVPGTYRLSSFSTVFHALYRAGGVSSIGSLRSIRVMRGGREVAVVDVYAYLMEGAISDDIRLEEGDVILVPPYEELVHIEGKVKRPMYYEMKSGETLTSLLEYAGGFMGDAYTKEVRVIRRTGRENRLFSVEASSFPSWSLADGDAVTVGAILDRFANRVEIRGAVYRPGMYELGGSLNTVKELVTRAEGLTGDAFCSRVLLTREREDLTHEVLAIDLEGVMSGRLPDVPLQREDVLVIPSIHELQAKGAFTIAGEVTRPGVYPYAENTTLEDLLVQAGGLLESASTVKVDISRRLRDAKSLESGKEIGQIFTFAVKDGFVIDGTPGFVLEPFDVVEVRRSPGYQVQRRVTIAGEVTFAGGYTLIRKNERLSDLVKRAGGVTSEAYVRGGRLIRQMNEEERAQRQAALDMALMNAGSDSVSVAKLRLGDSYTVGIELDKALANPGSDYDVVLREGDYLYIPEYISTVKIMGEVQFPNTVTYIAGKSKSYYINQAGGYGKMAKKRRAYVVHMNGTVTRIKRLKSGQIEPGCQIIVPSKKERKGVGIAEIISLTTSAASVGTMAATIANLLK
ncbi:MAG TPA: SLBB domain-containing protein [Mediterranea massiliensis]|uniref:SLBB domain-containing protein n=1 Tax=Mediterranea massiliensis TaxID=1841865 RepID=A0A921HYJ6_9BACT|nr:SLBB domain-containing protein [Mediterranea massiliensis]HJF92151.1 SLBB domain-containing protein [Mediterranea massiliensis]